MKEFIRSQWTKAIEKVRAILAAIEPLLPDDSAGNA